MATFEFDPLKALDIHVAFSDLFNKQGFTKPLRGGNTLRNILTNQTFREIQGLSDTCSNVVGKYLFDCSDNVICDDENGFASDSCDIEEGDGIEVSAVTLCPNVFCKTLKKIDDCLLCEDTYADQLAIALKSATDSLTKKLSEKVLGQLTAVATEVPIDLSECNLGTIACEYDKVCGERDYLTLSSGLLKAELFQASASSCCDNKKGQFDTLGLGTTSFDSQITEVYGKDAILMIDPNCVAFFNRPLYSLQPTLVDSSKGIYNWSFAHPTLTYSKNGTQTPIYFNVVLQKVCNKRNKDGKHQFLHNLEVSLIAGFHLVSSPCEDCSGVVSIVESK